jgi:hypothetical protein
MNIDRIRFALSDTEETLIGLARVIIFVGVGLLLGYLTWGI